MNNYKGINYLRSKLDLKRDRVLLRYKYYDMKNATRDLNISSPPQLQNWFSSLGWCARAVDSVSDRIQFRTFKNDNFDINNIYDLNNRDILFDSAIQGALIGSCSFIYISSDAEGFPRLQVINGDDATGIIDPITYMLREGYAVLERDQNRNAVIEAYFTAEETIIKDKKKRTVDTIANPAPYPLLVPVIFRPNAQRPFGHSRISRSCMSIVGSALRTIKRSEISAEFYSYPQRYVLGTDPEGEPIDKWKATIASMLEISTDGEGNTPTLGQFSQQSMQPHTDQLRMFASLFAGEAGLTLDDLGFSTENPSSAEAIKASHENLRVTARKAQRTFGVGFLNAGYLAACVRDNFAYQRKQLYLTTPTFEPIFEPDSAMLSSIGDGAIKLNQAVPGYFDEEAIDALTGLKR